MKMSIGQMRPKSSINEVVTEKCCTPAAKSRPRQPCKAKVKIRQVNSSTCVLPFGLIITKTPAD